MCFGFSGILLLSATCLDLCHCRYKSFFCNLFVHFLYGFGYMKIISWKQSLGVVCALTFSVCAFADKLSVTIEGIGEVKGNILISAHNTKASWLTKVEPFAKRKIPVTQKTMVVDFGEVPEGTYAVMLFQDLNGNGILDMNMIGIPKEPFGFSNNGGSFGPPSFDEARIDPAQLKNVVIRLK